MASYETLDDLARAVGALPEAEREQAIARFRHLAVSSAPAEEVAKPPISTLGSYLATPLPEPPTLVEPGQIVQGALTVLTAPGGKGKTAMTLNRVLRWAQGKPMFDDLPDCMAPVRPLKTLIVENEGAAGFFQQRIQILAEQGMKPNEEDLKLMQDNIFIWGDGGYSALKLDNQANVDLVRRGIEACEPDIVLFEPLRGLWVGDENNATEMNVVMDAINAMAHDYAMGVIVNHHERKSGVGEQGEPMFAARGSVVISDLAAVMERWRSAQGGALRELSWTKSRFAQPAQPVRMEFDPITWRYSHIPEDSVERDVLKTLYSAAGEWFHTQEVSETISEPVDKARRVLNRLADEDRIKKTRAHGGGFVYRVTNNGDDEGGMSF